MSIQHVALATGSIDVDECEVCGGQSLMTVTVYAMTDDGVQEFGQTDRCLTCEPFIEVRNG